jgi:hypothetical protein
MVSVLIAVILVLITNLMDELDSIHSATAQVNQTISTNVTDTLKSLTSNVSTSIQNTIDKMIADTYDGMMDSTINMLLKNTTQSGPGNTNASDAKFEPKVPSGIDLSQFSNPIQVNSSNEHYTAQYSYSQ